MEREYVFSKHYLLMPTCVFLHLPFPFRVWLFCPQMTFLLFLSSVVVRSKVVWFLLVSKQTILTSPCSYNIPNMVIFFVFLPFRRARQPQHAPANGTTHLPRLEQQLPLSKTELSRRIQTVVEVTAKMYLRVRTGQEPSQESKTMYPVLPR